MPGRGAYGCLYELLAEVADPRAAPGRRHHIADVLFVALVAVVAGAEDAQAIEDFGTQHEDWFRKRCGLRHGIPSQDTYLRVLATMEPRSFGEASMAHLRAGHGSLGRARSRGTTSASAGVCTPSHRRSGPAG